MTGTGQGLRVIMSALRTRTEDKQTSLGQKKVHGLGKAGIRVDNSAKRTRTGYEQTRKGQKEVHGLRVDKSEKNKERQKSRA
jgi:hypothetical protein